MIRRIMFCFRCRGVAELYLAYGAYPIKLLSVHTMPQYHVNRLDYASTIKVRHVWPQATHTHRLNDT